MPVYEREFVVDGSTVTIGTDKDADRVIVDVAGRDPVVVNVDESTAIVDEPIPGWAEKPLAQVGVHSYDYERREASSSR